MFDRRTPLKKEIDAASPIILHHFMLKCCSKINDLLQSQDEQCSAFIQKALRVKARWLIGEASLSEVRQCQKEGKEVYRYFDEQVKMGRLPLTFWYWGAAIEHLCTTSMSRKNIEKKAINTIDACRFAITLKDPTLKNNAEIKQQQASELRELRLEHEAQKQQELEALAGKFSATLMDGMFT